MELILHTGDCVQVLATMDADSVDAIVTDPPYALDFMGKGWDKFTPAGFQAWCETWARECLRVLKPGGHMLAFGGTRTYHRLAAGVEDAGFEIRDSLHWIYGSGFPKSLDVSKAIDKAAGAEREVTGKYIHPATGKVHADFSTDNDRTAYSDYSMCNDTRNITAPATDDAKTWQGWGTALKPAHEPIIVARKPLSAKTVAANVLRVGTGALNIDGCRVAGPQVTQGVNSNPSSFAVAKDRQLSTPHDAGRWPANVLLGPDAADEMDAQSGVQKSGVAVQRNGGGQAIFGGISGAEGSGAKREDAGFGDTGGASRFFPIFKYQAKAPKSERPRLDDGTSHPTVKPVALMRWLVRLVTPPGGIVLDPFGGSGTTAEACAAEGFECVMIERDPAYAALIRMRLSGMEKAA